MNIIRETYKAPPSSDEGFERTFDIHLGDSITLAILAESEPSSFWDHETFARASITSSLLLLEAAANACLECLAFESNVHDEFDRLPLLSKFELFVRLKFRGKKLSRGTHHIEFLRELKNLRDSLSHPKHIKTVWQTVKKDEQEAIPNLTKHLKIQKSSRFRTAKEAVAVMRAVHEFFAYFFGDICEINPTQVSAILFSEEKVPNPKVLMVPYFPRSFKKQLAQWKVDISYLKLGWQ